MIKFNKRVFIKADRSDYYGLIGIISGRVDDVWKVKFPGLSNCEFYFMDNEIKVID